MSSKVTRTELSVTVFFAQETGAEPSVTGALNGNLRPIWRKHHETLDQALGLRKEQEMEMMELRNKAKFLRQIGGCQPQAPFFSFLVVVASCGDFFVFAGGHPADRIGRVPEGPGSHGT